MNLSIDHINMSVVSLDSSRQWYRDLFGFEEVESGLRDGNPWAILRSGDTMLCLYEYPKINPVSHQDRRKHHEKIPGINHFSFRISDPDTWIQLIKEKNVTLGYGGGKISYPFSDSWYVLDPSGHEIEVVYWHSGIQF